MIDIRPATLDDVLYLAPRLRAADVREIEAMSGYAPEIALAYGLGNSHRAMVGTVDGLPIGIYGMKQFTGARVAFIWMVATESLVARKREFLRRSKSALAELGEGMTLLWCLADARNTAHHEWLEWCGFAHTTTKLIGVQNRPFREYVKHV